MKKFLWAALFAAASLMAAEIPLINANFVIPPGKSSPPGWYPMNKLKVRQAKLADGKSALEIPCAVPEGLVMQGNLKVKTGQDYQLTIRFKGPKGVTARTFVECISPGYTKSKRTPCTGEWQSITLPFRFAKINTHAYLCLGFAGKNEGSILFAEPRITEAAPVQAAPATAPAQAAPAGKDGNVIKNTDFVTGKGAAAPAYWGPSAGTTAKQVKLPDGKFGMQVFSTKTECHLMQVNPAIKPGMEYELSVSFKGPKDVFARVIAECTKPGCSCGKRFRCTGEWQSVKLPVYFADIQRTAYVILGYKGKTGGIIFRDPKLVPVPGKFRNGTFSLGANSWQLTNGKIVNNGSAMGNVLELNSTQKPARAVQNGIQLKGGQRYQLHYEVRGGSDKRYVDIQGATWFRVVPVVNGKALPGTEHWQDSFSSWQTKSVDFVPAKDMTADIAVEIRDPGIIQVDNIELTAFKGKVEKASLTLFQPAAFRNTIYLGSPAGNVLSGKVHTILNVKTCTAECNGQKQVVPVGGTFRFTLDKPGTYQLKVTVAGADPMTRTITVVKGKVPKVAFRDDNVMLLDGVPFFPLAAEKVHSPLPKKEIYRRVAAAHFNTVSALDLQDADTALEAGCFCYSQGVRKMPVFRDPKALANWRTVYLHEFAKMNAHPGILGFFFQDEAHWAGIPVSVPRTCYEFLRPSCPERFLWLNEAPRGTPEQLRPYAEVCDIYGIDIYPIPAPNSHSGLNDKMMTSVGRYTDHCRESVRDGKMVLMVLQAFAWGALTKNPPNVYPTHAENRFMAYNAITHGATALSYYGICEGETRWDFVELLGKTIKELRELSPMLTARTVTPSALTCGNPDIRILHKRLGKLNCYIAVNESPKAAQVSFAGARDLKVLFENRRMQKVENFAPYDVHVYFDGDKLPAQYSYPALRNAKKTQDFDVTGIEKANWIWLKGKVNVRGSKVVFRKDFTLSELPVKAELLATFDDFGCAQCNGKTVIEHHLNRGWNMLSAADVTKLLRKGKNTIFIKAMDGGGAPCGAIFMLRLTGKDGKRSFIVSDGSTLAAPYEAPARMEPAAVLCPAGTHPWSTFDVRPAQTDLIGKTGFPM